MKTLKTLTFAAAFAAAGIAHSADPQHIADYGEDGDARYYQVRCTDGRVASLRVLAETKEVCYSTPGGEVCTGSWSVREAAVAACQ